jgi:sulfur-oxidizing protein SoxX
LAGLRAILSAALAASLAGAMPGLAEGGAGSPAYGIVKDAIPVSLTGTAGNAARGRMLVLDRRVGLCLLCHSGPFPEERFQGTIGPDLSGIGARLSEGQIRLRIVEPARINTATIMPAYFRTEGLTRVGTAFRGKSILSAQQIEDIVAFLTGLRDESR